MAFDDVFGDADEVAQNLYDHATESSAGSVDDDLMRGRLARKLSTDPWVDYENRRKDLEKNYGYTPGVTPLKKEQPPQDFSTEGIPVDTSKAKPDFSAEATPVEEKPEEKPKEAAPPPPALTAGEQVAAAGKAAAQSAAIAAVADPLKAAALTPEMRKQAYDQAKDRATLEGGGYATAPQTPEEAEKAGAAFGVAGPYKKEIKAREREQAAAQEQLAKELAVPPQERPLYKAGEAFQKKVEKAIPLTDQEKDSIGGKIGSFFGGAVPAVALTIGGSAIGMPELGMALGATQMGMQSAGASFEKAINAGATPEEAARAAGMDGIVGGGLGVVPLGAILAPVRAAGTPILDMAGNEIGRKIAPGVLGWMAAKLEQAVKSGITFAGVGEAQEWLSKQIASEYNASAREKLKTDQARLQSEIDKVKADPKLAEANKTWLDEADKGIKKYDEQIKDPSKYEVDWERIGISFFGGGVLGALHPHGMAREEPPPDQYPPMPPDPNAPPGTPPPAAGAGTGPGGPGAGAGGPGGGPAGGGPGAGGAPGGGYTAPPRPPPTDTPRQARMRPAFEKGLSDAGVNEPNMPFDELRDLYQTVDGLRTGFGRTDLAGKSPADLKAMFEQLSLLKGHGFTTDELRTMAPADIAREYAQAVKEGAQAGAAAPEAEPQQEQQPGQAEASVQEPPRGGGPVGPTGQQGDLGETAATPATGTRDDPIELNDGAAVERAAGLARQDHSHDQGEAHNVQQGYGSWNGLHIAFEAPAGGIRRGTNPRTGEPWEGRVGAATGYIVNGPPGNDGDKLDVYFGSNPSNPTVWVLDEVNKTGGKFRQTKSFIGFNSPQEAVDAYLKTDNKSAEQIGGMTPMLQPDFVNWVHNGDHTQPVRNAPPGAAAPVGGPAALPSPSGEGEGAIEVQPHHVQAIENAITAAGHPLHDVSPVDLALAAEYHARGVRDPREAFQLSFLVNGLAKGYFTPEDISEVYGEDAAQTAERLSAETVGDTSQHGEASAPEGVATGEGLPEGGAEAAERGGVQGEDRLGEGAGADVGHATSTEPAGGTEAAGAEVAGERPGAETGHERPVGPHGGERPTTGHTTGHGGERTRPTETDKGATEPGHAETAGPTTHGGTETDKGAEAEPHKAGEAAAVTEYTGPLHRDIGKRAEDQRAYQLGHQDVYAGIDRYEHPEVDRKYQYAYDRGRNDARRAIQEGTAPTSKQDIVDVGEKIGGARKDQYGGLTDADIGQMNQAERARDIIKAKVWPRPDYVDLVENGGVDKMAAALIKQVYDRIAVKPRYDVDTKNFTDKFVQTEIRFAENSYVKTLRAVRDALVDARTVEQVEAANRKFRSDPNIRDNSNMYRSAMPTDRLQWTSPLQIDSSMRSRAEKLVKMGFPSIEPWQRMLKVRDAFDWKTGTSTFVVKRGTTGETVLRDFKTREEAEQAARALYEQWKGEEGKTGKVPNRPHLDKLERIGPDVRNGRNVTGDDFMKDFGFRAVEFGQWVASDERQRIVNHAYDALHDLARALNIPPKAVSLDGRLAIAFGSRGMGGFAAAHYEPARFVMNMTKITGAGSLAHEWTHALDHYLGDPKWVSGDRDEIKPHTFRGHWGLLPTGERGHKYLGAYSEKLPQKLQVAVNRLMEALLFRPETHEEYTDRVTKKLEAAKKSLQGWEEYLEWRRQRFSSGNLAAQSWVADRRRSDKAIGQWKSEVTRWEEALNDPHPTHQIVSTDYWKEADKLSGKSGEYWKRPLELLARATESYVFDKLKAAKHSSDYLVHSVEPTRYAGEAYKGNPYPAGQERKVINALLDRVMAALTTTAGKHGEATKIIGREGDLTAEDYAPVTIGPEHVSDEDINAAIEAEIGRMAQEANKPKRERQKREVQYIQGNGQWRAGLGEIFSGWHNTKEEAREEYDRLYKEAQANKPKKTAGQAAKGAGKAGASFLDEATAGLSQLFGAGKTFGAGPTFDKDTYEKAKPFFHRAAAHFEHLLDDLTALAGALVRHMRDAANMTLDGIREMQVYLAQYVKDIRDGVIKVRQIVADLKAEKARERDRGGSELGEEGVGETGAELAGGEPAGKPGAEDLGAEPAGHGVGAEEVSGGEGTGAHPGEQVRGGGEAEHQGGTATDGRPGGGGEGLADAGAGGRGRSEHASLRSNYHISDPESLIGGTPKVRFGKNRAAIEAYRAITDENRDPTKAELDAMAGYTGWGSFGQELFNGTWDRPRPMRGWENEDKWLREHLGADEWKSAQESIINAHYTDPPTVQAMWDMARAMGFDGGRVLEPSMGIGNFFGLMPRDLMEKSDLTGIEMDKLTGGMAKILYPQANVQIKPYQESMTPDNFYDLAIGNWPFAAEGPVDRRYNALSPTLHDYFFVKALDQVRPGGLVMGITSAGSMDKVGKQVRIALAKNADLVAAFRLPSGAFQQYAGTKVVTDIIILKKREKPVVNLDDQSWLESSSHKVPSGEIRTNEYWRKYPDRVLGTLDWGHGTTTGRPGMVVSRLPNYGEQLENLKNRVPKDVYQSITRGKEQRFEPNNTTDRQGAITVHKDGKLYLVSGERLLPLDDVAKYKTSDAKKNDAREHQLKSLVEMRRAYGRLIDAERDGAPNTSLLRDDLRRQYEAFVKKHGKVVDSDGLSIMRKLEDPYHPILGSLERPDGSPSRILTESTTRSKKKLEHPTVRDAFALQRNASRNLDIEKIAEMARAPVEQVIDELSKENAIYRTVGGGHEVSDVFLSGNVRRKLKGLIEARDGGELGLDKSIDAIAKVVPENIPYYKIEAKLGATWVPNADYEQFVADLLGVKPSKDIEIKFSGSRWKVKLDPALNQKPEATSQWGHVRYPFSKLLRAAMGNQNVKIYDPRDDEGGPYFNAEATAEVNDKIAKVRDEFQSWAWRDAERKVRFEQAYNDITRAIATPHFDGSFLEFPGMTLRRGNEPFNLRQHQANAIWRGIVNQSGLYAHEVGTGKTYTMAGLAVESRRYGVARKPMIFAHNANSASVAAEFKEMYPGANVLYIDNLASDQIATMLRRVANEDWDAIVVPHSLVNRFTLSEKTLTSLMAEEIAALEEEAITAAQDDGITLNTAQMDNEADMKKVRSPTAKKLVNQRNRIKNKIAEHAQRASKENAIPFEDLGVDMLMIDEVQAFKKPPISTGMKVRGLDTDVSDRSLSLRFLTGYVKGLNNGRGIHLFTGTPITNSLVEIYNMQRYVMDQEMGLAGVKEWDAWFNTFADADTDVELTAAGDYEPVTRLQSFVNVADLRQMIGQYMDIVFADEMPEFKPREINGKTMAAADLTNQERSNLLNGRTEKPIGRPYKKIINDVGPMSPDQQAALAHLSQLAQEFKQASGKQRRDWMLAGNEHNPVVIETGAANAGLDARLYNSSASDHPQSKVNRVLKNLLHHYNEHPQATQVVFVDRGHSDTSRRVVGRTADGEKIYANVEKFNLVKDIIDKLVKGGVKKEEIAVINGSTAKPKRKAIADAMNEAKIRVVIGHRDALGVGVNMQVNLRAMHHMDAPWTPGTLEQANGRGWRQGNKWNTVLEYRYITDRLDGRRWQVLSIKDRFIKDFMHADANLRVIEGDAANIEEGDTAASDLTKTLAEAAGDPRILIRAKLTADVAKLEKRERLHTYGQADATAKARELRRRIETSENNYLPPLRADAEKYEAAAKDGKFGAEVSGQTYTKRDDANAAMAAIVTKLQLGQKNIPLATIQGFKVDGSWLEGFSEPTYMLRSQHRDVQVRPTVASIEGTLRYYPHELENEEKANEEREASAKRLDAAAQEPFGQLQALADKKQQLANLEKDLATNPVGAPPWLRQGAPVGTRTYVRDGDKLAPLDVMGHQWGPDDYYVLAGADERKVPYLKALDENGNQLYEPHPWQAPPTKEKAAATGEVKPTATFGGERGATADRTQLDRAKAMEAAKKSPEEIWKETGWWHRRDGWRYEIDDSKLRFKPGALEAHEDRFGRKGHVYQPRKYKGEWVVWNVTEGHLAESQEGGMGRWEAEDRAKQLTAARPRITYTFNGKLGDLIEEKGLFRSRLAPVLQAYPHLADAPVRIGEMHSFIAGGGYDTQTGNILVDNHVPNEEELLKTLLHEISHAIQKYEGFSGGGHGTSLLSRTRAALYDLDQQIKSLRPGSNIRAELEKLRGQLKEQEDLFSGGHAGWGQTNEQTDSYKRLLGEVEARNAEWRLRMTPEERLANPPWTTEDVPAAEQYSGTDLTRFESTHAATINHAVNEEWKDIPKLPERWDGISLSPQYGGDNNPKQIAGARTNIAPSMKFTPEDVADKIRIYGAKALSDHLQEHIDYRRVGMMLPDRETGELKPSWTLPGSWHEKHVPPDDELAVLEAVKGVVDRVMARHPEVAEPSGYTVRPLDREGLIERYSGRQYTQEEWRDLRDKVIDAIEKMGESGELTPDESRELSYDFGSQGLDPQYGVQTYKAWPKVYAKHKALVDEYERASDYVNYSVNKSNAGIQQSMHAILTPRAIDRKADIEKIIRDEIERMVGNKVGVELVDANDLGAVYPGHGMTAGPLHRTVASYTGHYNLEHGFPVQGVIRVALAWPNNPANLQRHADKLLRRVNHEAVHALIDLAATDQEVALLQRERPRNRKLIQQHFDYTDQEAESMSGFEVDAIAGELYMEARDRGGPGTEFPLHVGIRALFERLWRLLRRIGNALRNLGFQTSEDIFRKMQTGEMRERPWRDTFGMDSEDRKNLGPVASAERPEPALETLKRGIEKVREELQAPVAPKPEPSVGFMGSDRISDIAKDFWTSTFQPELVSDRALEADPLFARYKSAQAQEKDAIIKQFDEGWKYWNKKPDADRFRFLDDMEHGRPTGNPYEDAMMHTWRRLLDENHADERRWGSKAAFVQDYVPHVWEKPDQWRAFAERMAAQMGPTWFQKARTFDYISEGLAHGLKLRYTNPADLIVHRLLSGVDMRQRMQLLYDLKPMGLAWEGVQGGQQLMRRGWQPINAPDRKQWMIHPDAQKLWKNAVEAQGLWGAEGNMGNIFRGWMKLKNTWVPIKLALSAFHPLHVLHINQAQMITLSARSLRRGDLAGAMKELGEGLATIPTLGLPSMRKGGIVKQAWEKRPADQTAMEKATVGMLNEMGITAQLSEQLKIAGRRKLAESWARMMRGEGRFADYAMLLPRGLGRAIEVISGPVFEHWIPALKVNAALMEAHDAFARDPSLLNDPIRRRLALRGIGKSIDNRFGEMFYGSLFWDRYVKDAGIASFLSLGWNLGFAREFVGGAAEAITRPIGAIGRATGIQAITPSAPRQTIQANTSKMGFVFTYLMTAALINGLMSYLLSGKPPEGWDFIFARIGGENPDGSPRRITNMSYLREIPMLIKHIQEHGGNIITGLGEMVWSKMMFEPIREIWNNRDYYGYNVRDENAPFYTQAWQTIRHGFGDQTPISISSAQRALDTGGTWSKDVVLAALGFGPAPAYVEKSAIQNRISYLYNEHVAPQSKTYQEGEVSHEKMRARTRLLMALQSKDPEQIKQAKADALKAGYSNNAVGAIGRIPSDVFLFSKLPPADQEAILRQASPKEFDRYIGHAQQKLRKPMRDERAGKEAEAPAARPAPAAPATPAPPPPRTRSDDILSRSPLR